MTTETGLSAAESAALDRLEADAWAAYGRGDCVPIAGSFRSVRSDGVLCCCGVGAASLAAPEGKILEWAEAEYAALHALSDWYVGFDCGFNGDALFRGYPEYARGHAFGVRVRAEFGGGAGRG